LFHAEGDSVCPITETRAIEAQLRQQGTNVALETVATGEHYDSMIE
jgi:predicted esterase